MRITKFVVAALAAALFVPSIAAAATPPVLNPVAEPVKGGKPVFTWALGPAGETVRAITISNSPAVDERGDLTGRDQWRYESDLDALTQKQLERPLYSGTYYYNAFWRYQAPGAYESGYTPVQSFTVPKMLRNLKGSYTQYRSISAFMAKGTFISNGKTATVKCRVYNGKKIISKQTKKVTYITPYTKTNFYCSNMKVSERLDGKRLKFWVEVRSGGKKQVAKKFFRAT